VGSPWLDRIGLTDAPALFELLDRHPQVRGMVCGHVHQALELRRGRLRVFSAPASCVQFEPGPELRLGNPQPGYRRLRLWPDGRLETQAVLLPEALRRSA
jgi:Icc protein